MGMKIFTIVAQVFDSGAEITQQLKRANRTRRRRACVMTLTTRERDAGELWNRMPGERSAWLGKRALVELVLEAVCNVDGQGINPPAPSSQ